VPHACVYMSVVCVYMSVVCVRVCARAHTCDCACVSVCVCINLLSVYIHVCVLCVCVVGFACMCIQVCIYRIMVNFRILTFTITNANQAYVFTKMKRLCFALPFTLLYYENLFSKNGSEFSNYSKITCYKVCCVACLFMCLHESIV